MALLHKTDIRPTKLELLSTWLPAQDWYAGPPAPVVDRVGAARFDDPAGEVGLEVMLVRVGDGPVLHVPLTYRGAPLDGASRFLVGTTEHGVLGRRWVYDAAGDPVFVKVLGDAIRDGAEQAVEELHGDGGVTVREPNLLLRGTGSTAPSPGETVEVTGGEVTRIRTTAGELHLFRLPAAQTTAESTLTGEWQAADAPVVLARLLA
ncbi:hypothetical protein Acy02nite_84560 [Actinoplanes cyaneus]|uniref:Maltokinase N-terminal cap domain-containing protein n=1 Tax=Actinoplanes cyaneus TaxID=52696 RepID=A0A919IQX2_9ACTN|nr:hypothetical protein [Actinoplanes cyaneus]MCW2143794.1 hypothetical protein [Actinoplanes cyaneus]GID70575.1 hypothetical protein Acy02nite_84560 [Actinoplanes cyaneus]